LATETAEDAARWIAVLPAAAVPPGRAVRAWAGETRLVVGRGAPGAVDGDIGRVNDGDDAEDDAWFAAVDVCPHLELPLAAFGPAEVRRGRLICPWHLWEFDTRSGRCEHASLYADDEIFFFQLEGKAQPASGTDVGRLRCFRTRVRHGVVEVELERTPCRSGPGPEAS
jgi:nitrite reductase/ring-hydroxylating ferredoxin subunit